MAMDSLSSPTHILHIGGHIGQEAPEYIHRFHNTLKSITFIECDPNTYQKLVDFTSNHQGVRGVEIHTVQALVSDTEGEKVPFQVATNYGCSSSIFPPNSETWAWADVGFLGTIELTTTRAETLLHQGVLQNHQDTLILDTQGSELKVLKGLGALLDPVQQIITEYSTQPFQKGGVLLSELQPYLESKGFKVTQLPEGNTHADLVCRRI